MNAIAHPANGQDRDGAVDLLKQLKKLFPGLKLVWADHGYNAHKLSKVFAAMGDWKLEIVKRSDAAKGFEVRLVAGPWSARLHGWAATAASPNTSSVLPPPPSPTSSSP